MSKKANKNILALYPRPASLMVFAVGLLIYCINSYLYSNNPINERQLLFQLIFASLALVSFLSSMIEVYLFRKQNNFYWKITSLLFAVIIFYIALINILSLLSVNFI